MLDTFLSDLNSGFTVVPFGVSAARLLLAAILCGAVGFEREMTRRPAGLRTHILVGVAACIFIIIGQELSSLDYGRETELRIDPLRLIEAVTAGVAFLAAGIIFTSRGRVRNITTGASLWLAGAIGMACGAGQAVLAIMASGIVIFVVVLLGWVERCFSPKHSRQEEEDRDRET
ncbi:MgtC/SapB family protein [uncultured Jannaschia sp.]|uniref:MgtC/SapB family protein n=1 Tax=uncultured Jannaschia sp. TaxID=293347 RepID=UPI0026394726|nr:MgtC/SapB family protein [uncultured Jannaschia sp.]